jgi:MFS family permease
MVLIRAEHPAFRFIVLFFNCMLTFGSYYCFDMPSVLQRYIESPRIPCNDSNTDNCCNSTHNDCLGLSHTNYNLLYAIYAWTNAILVIFSGFLIDKVGNAIGLFLFSVLCLTGSTIFTVGTMMSYESSAMFPLMLLGRLMFGSGNGSLTVVQNRLTAYWFQGKELALAFGVTLAFSRLGSVLNFFFTDELYQSIGMKGTLWFGVGLCSLGFLSSIIVISLDNYGTKQLGTDGDIKTASKNVKVSDIRFFGLSTWLLFLTIMFFYNGVFPFVADAVEFINQKYFDK